MHNENCIDCSIHINIALSDVYNVVIGQDMYECIT